MRPILFHIGNFHIGNYHVGSFPVRSYGIMILIGFFAGLWLVRKRAARYGLDPVKVSDPAFYALIAGILGARVLYIAQEWDHYKNNLNEVFSLNFAGLTSFGGFIFGAFAVMLWARWHKVRIGVLTDLFAPGFMLGHVFGRIGCLLNGCCYGGVCDPSLPWATHFTDAPGVHHPAQVYDALMNLAGLGLLLWYERTRARLAGQVTGLFLILHGLARFIYEFWRAGTDEQVRANLASSTYWGKLPITQAQGMALAMMVLGVAVWLLSRHTYRQTDTSGDTAPANAEPAV